MIVQYLKKKHPIYIGGNQNDAQAFCRVLMDYISLVILGCAVVTFIPRLIPALFIDKLNFSPKFEKFLNLIPYTALAALICPGVLTVDSQLWYIGLIGAVVAAGLAWKKVPMGAIVILTVVVLITVYSIVPMI